MLGDRKVVLAAPAGGEANVVAARPGYLIAVGAKATRKLDPR